MAAADAQDWPRVDRTLRSLQPGTPAPAVQQPLVAQGEQAIAQGRYEDAVAALEQATRQQPGDWRAWSRLGYALLRSSGSERAQQAAQNAIRLRPDDPGAWITLAEALAGAGKTRAATTALRLSLYCTQDRAAALAYLRDARNTRVRPALRDLANAEAGPLAQLPPRNP